MLLCAATFAALAWLAWRGREYYALPLLERPHHPLHWELTPGGSVARWIFRGGHDLGLTLGGSESSLPDLVDIDARTNEWIRLSGTLQLPFRLYLHGEYEISTGDDLEGDRLLLEIAYRF